MTDYRNVLERDLARVGPAPFGFDDVARRRDRKRRNQRIGAVTLAIVLALVSFVALTRAFRAAERPADEPTPRPQGIFSEVGGWIAYGNRTGIWAVDPSRPDDPDSRVQLSAERGIPLAWSGDGSKLLILGNTRDPMQPHRLFVLNADGSETDLATIEGAILHGNFVSGGSFSPDGSQVIYTERASMYLVDTQGGTPQKLFTPGRRWSRSCECFFRHPWPFNPTYSPDGTQIAYTDGVGDNSHQLRVMNADGSGTRVLVDERNFHTMHNVAWSPDGERLVFGLGTSVGIYVVGSDGSGLTLLIPGATYPNWSPDGSRVSYQPCDSYSRCRLQIADADGSHVVEFGHGRSGPWNPLVQPAFSVAETPAARQGSPLGIFSEVGGWIAYANERGTSGIWAVNPEAPVGSKDQIRLSPGTGWPVAWSSDGSKLLILRRNGGPPPPHQAFIGGNLFVLNADGTEARLTNGDAWITGGSFSPDGSKVVYATWGDSPQRIVLVSTAGGQPRVLLTGELLDAPTFSPDGSKIAYFGRERLRVMNADGSGSRVLTHDVFGAEAYARRLAWSPDGTRIAIDFFGNTYTIGADGSDLTQVIPLGRSPNWSPDGSRIAYDLGDGSHLEIADADGTHVVEIGYARSGPWNPLVHPEPELGQVPDESEGPKLTSTLVFVVALMALIAMAILIRRRMERRSRP